MMRTDDLLTVRKFAETAGVSRQRIYQLMAGSLQPYVVRNGSKYTLLKAEGLQIFESYGDLTADKGDLTADKGDLTADKGDLTADKGDLTADKGDLTADKGDLTADKGDTDWIIDTLKDEIKRLHEQITAKDCQIREKDTQISLLQAHTADQQQTIRELTGMLHPQQQLNAAAAVIQQQLIDHGKTEQEVSRDNGDDQREEIPKRGFFARIFGNRSDK